MLCFSLFQMLFQMMLGTGCATFSQYLMGGKLSFLTGFRLLMKGMLVAVEARSDISQLPMGPRNVDVAHGILDRGSSPSTVVPFSRVRHGGPFSCWTSEARYSIKSKETTPSQLANRLGTMALAPHRPEHLPGVRTFGSSRT